MSNALQALEAFRVPAGWRAEMFEGQWRLDAFVPQRMTVELRHISGTFVRVSIDSRDEWAWVADHLLPALSGLPAGERPVWMADAPAVRFATGRPR